MAFLDSILDPILQPLMNYSSLLTVVVLAFIISLLISVVYKFMTDQNKMRYLKGRQKEFQKEMKELRSEPEKMMAKQKEAMKINMEYMKASFKPTLITMLPIILIFGWMSASLAFEPIYPGESFIVITSFGEDVTGNAEIVLGDDMILVKGNAEQKIEDGSVSWKLKSSKEGLQSFGVTVNGETENRPVLITKDLDYTDKTTTYSHSDIESITLDYNKLTPLGNIDLFGWKPGWLGLYIIFSLVFSMSIRKLMGLY